MPGTTRHPEPRLAVQANGDLRDLLGELALYLVRRIRCSTPVTVGVDIVTADFDVAPELLRNVASVLRGSAEDLRAVRLGWDRQTVGGAAAFGTTECAEAFQVLQETWFQDLGSRIAHLTDLADAARDSANTYAQADETVRQDFA